MDDHIKLEISTYLAGALTESRNRQIEAHVASCDKCRTALNRARSKQARTKREALKKASAEKIPNFFLARQGKSSSGPAFLTSGLVGKAGLLVVILGILFGISKMRMTQQTTPLGTVTDGLTLTMVEPNPPEVAETPKGKTVEPAKAVDVTAKPPAVSIPIETKPAPAALTPKGTQQIAVPQAPDIPKAPLVLPILQSWKGVESSVQDDRVLVIRRQESWERLWAEMQMTEPLPIVDFLDKLVLAIFAGPSPAGSSIDVGKIEEVGEAMVAPYRVTSPLVSVSSGSPVTGNLSSHPYFIATVPRVDRKIKISRREAL